MVENVERLLAQGLSRRDAALKTMEEVGGALVSIALVLCADFVPTAYLGTTSSHAFCKAAPLRRLAHRLDRGVRALADAVDRGNAGPRRRAVDMHGWAPHRTWPQPNLVPVMPSTARDTKKAGVTVDIYFMRCAVIFNVIAMHSSRWLELI